MAFDIGCDKFAKRYDLQTLFARILKRGADEATTQALPFKSLGHLRVRKDQRAVAAIIDGNGEFALYCQLVSPFLFIVPNVARVGHHPASSFCAPHSLAHQMKSLIAKLGVGWLSCGLGDEFGKSHEVVGDHSEGEGGLCSGQAPDLEPGDTADGLGPAKGLLDPFADAQADGITIMTGRAAVDQIAYRCFGRPMSWCRGRSG